VNGLGDGVEHNYILKRVEGDGHNFLAIPCVEVDESMVFRRRDELELIG